MQRDILFFVRGLPQKYHISGKHFFMASDEGALCKLLTEIAESVPEFKESIFEISVGNMSVAGFRNNYENESDSVCDAWQRLEGILDGVSLLTEEQQCKVSSIFLLRQGHSPDAELKLYMPKGRVRWGTPTGEAAKAWGARHDQIANYVLAFVNCVSFEPWASLSEFRKQLAYSVKMFRYGIASGDPGIEYICKFSALEGLVCGSHTKNKIAMLKNRLKIIFEPSMKQIETDIQRLWEQRCEASHQAIAFDEKFQVDLPLLEKIFLGVFVFAVHHIEKAKTISELWDYASKFKLPGFVLLDPPTGTIKGPVRDIFITTNLKITNIGRRFDPAFQAGEKILDDFKKRSPGGSLEK